MHIYPRNCCKFTFHLANAVEKGHGTGCPNDQMAKWPNGETGPNGPPFGRQWKSSKQIITPSWLPSCGLYYLAIEKFEAAACRAVTQVDFHFSKLTRNVATLFRGTPPLPYSGDSRRAKEREKRSGSGLCLFKHLRDLPTLYFIVYLSDCPLMDPLGDGTAAASAFSAPSAGEINFPFWFWFVHWKMGNIKLSRNYICVNDVSCLPWKVN